MNSQLDLDTDAEQLLLQAANTARALVQLAEQRLVDLEAEVEKTKSQIVRLNQLASYSSPVLPPPQSRRSLMQQARDHATNEDRAKVAAQALTDINTVLSMTKQPLTINELSEHIRTGFGRTWADSTLYSHLGKGKNEGRYLNENNKWSLSQADEL